MINEKYIRLPNGNYVHHSFFKSSGTTSELESSTGHGALGTQEVQRPSSKRVLVRVTSFRKRLIDEDNLCEKYHVDLCRYAGIISGDAPEQTKIEVYQVKSKEEYIKIEVIK